MTTARIEVEHREIERAALELRLLYDGDAIDFRDYLRGVIELDELAGAP